MLQPRPLAVALLTSCVFLFAGNCGAADEDRAARQAELDRACEAARDEKLQPLRQQFIEECVKEKQFETRRECEGFYADYGGQSGSRAPLFYDLPPCVEAFEYAKSERSGG